MPLTKRVERATCRLCSGLWKKWEWILTDKGQYVTLWSDSVLLLLCVGICVVLCALLCRLYPVREHATAVGVYVRPP